METHRGGSKTHLGLLIGRGRKFKARLRLFRRCRYGRAFDGERKSCRRRSGRAGGGGDRLNGLVEELRRDRYFISISGETDGVSARDNFRMTFLPSIPFECRHGKAVHADRRQRVTNLIELEGLDDRGHDYSTAYPVLSELKTGGARRENKTPRAAIGRGESATLGPRLQMVCQSSKTLVNQGVEAIAGRRANCQAGRSVSISLRRAWDSGLPARGLPAPARALGPWKAGISRRNRWKSPKNKSLSCLNFSASSDGSVLPASPRRSGARPA